MTSSHKRRLRRLEKLTAPPPLFDLEIDLSDPEEPAQEKLNPQNPTTPVGITTRPEDPATLSAAETARMREREWEEVINTVHSVHN